MRRLIVHPCGLPEQTALLLRLHIREHTAHSGRKVGHTENRCIVLVVNVFPVASRTVEVCIYVVVRAATPNVRFPVSPCRA